MRRLTILCLALTIGGTAAAMAADPPNTLGQSIRKGSNAAQHATDVTAALQEAGFTDVRNASCSGEICNALATWEGNAMNLRVELRTGRIGKTGGSGPDVPGGPPNTLVQNIAKGANAKRNADDVTAALQQVGFTQVQNATCSGEICEAQALWEDKPQKLRVELRTRRIEAVAQ